MSMWEDLRREAYQEDEQPRDNFTGVPLLIGPWKRRWELDIEPDKTLHIRSLKFASKMYRQTIGGK